MLYFLLMARKTQTDNSYKIKTILTIVFLFLTLVAPLLGLVGVVFMWLWMQWKKWVKLIITAPFVFWLLSPLIVYSYLVGFQPVTIYGNAMQPNYKAGQHYVVKVVNKTHEIKRGEVYVVSFPETGANHSSLKRIIGLPYEKLLIENGKVYINGVELNESAYIPVSIPTNAFIEGLVKEGEEITIPADSYFVMGDNRSVSADSRVLGTVPRNLIQSAPWFCYSNCN